MDGGSRIVLTASDQLVLLDGRGTRILRGPGSFAVDASSAGQFGVRLGALWDPRRARENIGAVRGISFPGSRSPSVWLLDIGQAATFCVADPRALWLWRPTTNAARLTISDDGGATATLDWPASTPALAWPATLPVRTGSSYTLDLDGKRTAVRLVRPGPGGDTIESIAAALAAAGCDAQVEALARSVEIAAMATPDAMLTSDVR